MTDFERIRNKVQAHQNQGLPFHPCDPVILCDRLKQCPKDASLAIQWAYNAKGRLDGMRFETEEDEPLVGRLRLSQNPPEEQEKALQWLKNESPLRNRPSPGQSGHCELYYDRIFEVGVDGLLEDVHQASLKATNEQKDTYESFTIALKAFSDMMNRAAEDAGNEAAAERCRHVAHKPPRTFWEAVQLLWFVDVGVEIGDDSSLINPGRLDRRLIRFYERDLMEQRITYRDAVEAFALIYLYLNHTTPSGLAFGVMLDGGTVNDLSYASIDAVRLCRLVYPSVGVCANEKTPHSLKRLAIDVIAEGYPNPSFFNDAVIRKGLEYYGVPENIRGNYINSTCVEITPCGYSNVWVASPYYNLSQMLLENLETEAADFDAFMENYHKILAAHVKNGAADQKRDRETRIANRRRPLQSVFTNDCISRGRDIENGGARYNWIECSFVGLANLVDSLVVIREEIFKQKNLTQSQLLEILKDDFKSRPELRQKFLKSYPKYGQDNQDVDSLIPIIVGFIREEISKYRMPPDDALYIPGTFCWVMHQRLGEQTGSTPDGRVAGFPFADGAGPAQGREKLGPSAAVKSVCSWEHYPLVGGSAFNMKYSKELLATDDAREKLLALVNAFIKGGGFQTQINVTDNETLKKAIAHPDEYADLVVRIGGYTDYFVRLSPGMQQEILLRTQYTNI